jgi:glucan phosphoethanolaminetransferase (alkaline phosphatase superfamily)
MLDSPKIPPLGKFYIIWTSDHNELLGEGGLYGHGTGQLYPITAAVPFVVQTNDSAYLNELKKIYKPTHYEIAKSIALLLGFEIINKNEESDIFYVNGIDFNGKCGYIKCTKDIKNRYVSYETVR